MLSYHLRSRAVPLVIAAFMLSGPTPGGSQERASEEQLRKELDAVKQQLQRVEEQMKQQEASKKKSEAVA